MAALIFDCDGVLADTERYGHLPSFNEMFAEFGLPVEWSDADYAELLSIGGGKERMASILTPEFVDRAGLPTGQDALAEQVNQWHRRKTDIYTSKVESGAMPPRPGVRRLAQDAYDDGWLLAVASTSAERSVRSVLLHAMGETLAAHFSVFAGDVVPRKKPAPDIYTLAVNRLNVSASDGVAVEDSRNGLLAALEAGLACVVTTSSYTRDEDFTGAALVVTSLGDPPATSAEVLADPYHVDPAPFVQLDHLHAILNRRARAPESHQQGPRR